MAVALIGATLIQWLVFAARYILVSDRKRTETPLLISTMFAAIVWSGFVAMMPRRGQIRAYDSVQTSACASVHTGMTVPALRRLMGEPSRVVSESDARGPGAEAWAYDDARCIAHILENRVRGIDFD